MIDDLDKTKVTSSARASEDTVAAISTPPGPGAVGLVRISGPAAVEVGQRIFTPLSGARPDMQANRRAVIGHVHPPGDSGSPIDQAVWLFFAGPRSYTGEDIVEITVHGGPLIMAELLGAATAAGARLAEAGEFTRRAFLNGRLDLSQAEAVASLIFAGTSKARRVMLGQVEGAMGREAGVVRRALLDAKVLLETAIDFSEDVHGDMAGEELGGLEVLLERAVQITSRLLATSRQGIALKEGLKVVIVGAPNVGKSSLLNALIEEERAIVHEVAGTTRDFIEGRISIEGVPMVVVDTAGIREGAASVEEEGIRRTQRLMERADLLLVVLDGSRQPLDDELELLEATAGMVRVVVANKCDLPSSGNGPLPAGVVHASALTGHGVGKVKEAIYGACVGGDPALEETGGVVTSLRQADALTKIRDGCRQSLEGLGAGHGPELLAVGVDEALLGVGELSGEIATDEVLNMIFERFCIGK
ncbi:MAG: tRNA uridine-5-carboxymethylaminomethyl(34) synthesis GTPase MnmE [bacterium]|nr:tRNA uridine-5-carboxymethylaminomethyl(34) synthesis GTPase MnmE [bacterium]